MTAFGKTTDALALTLSAMIEQAKTECRFDQYQMADKVASWMQNDRRFDFVKNKRAFAQEAMDAKTHGRIIDLTRRQESRYDPNRPVHDGVSPVVRQPMMRS